MVAAHAEQYKTMRQTKYISTMMPMIGKAAPAGLLNALEKKIVANCLNTSKATAPMMAARNTEGRSVFVRGR